MAVSRATVPEATTGDRAGRDRDAVSGVRDETAEARLETAGDRDQAAAIRDRDAQDRDDLARLRDLEADAKTLRDGIVSRGEPDRIQAARDRLDAADDRSQAADDREQSAADRVQATSDRNEAADDRARAAIDRAEAARDRADAIRMLAESANNLKNLTTDELTGAWTRKLGLEAAARELERSHRTGEPLAVAFVDVDGLKQINDIEGHLAGDALLELTGKTLLSSLRPYDIVLRYGGDELVCFMPNLHEAKAAARLQSAAVALGSVNPTQSLTFGVAEARPDDTLESLIGRADADFLKARSLRARPL